MWLFRKGLIFRKKVNSYIKYKNGLATRESLFAIREWLNVEESMVVASGVSVRTVPLGVHIELQLKYVCVSSLCALRKSHFPRSVEISEIQFLRALRTTLLLSVRSDKYEGARFKCDFTQGNTLPYMFFL